MKAKAKLQPIYSDDHYRMARLVRSRQFQSRLQKTRESWTAFGIPVPNNGFARAKDYYAWMDKLRATCNATMKSKEVADAMEKVNNDASLSATEKVWHRFKVQDPFLPPLPHSVIGKLLEEAGFDPKNEQYRLFLTKHIFFGQKDFSEPFLTVQGRRNRETGEMDLFLKLEPYTKKEHIMAHWDWIANHIKRLRGYRGKNKRWETFERDLQIYTAYQQVENEVSDKFKRGEAGKCRLDELVWRRLKKENRLRFENMSFEQLRKAKSRIAALNRPMQVKESA